MESAIAPPPTADCPPGPDSFVPDPVPVVVPGATRATSAIPLHLAERVSIGPVPPWVIERPLENEALKESGSNPVLLLDRQFHAERRESFERVVHRLDTTRAVHDAGQWRLDFDPETQRLTIHSLTVRRGERSVDNAKLDRLRILQREENLDRLVIDGVFTVVVLLEDVRAGDVLDVSYSLHSIPRIFPDHFWGASSIPTTTALLDFHLRVRFRTERPLRWKSNDPKLQPAVREEEGETEWSWHIGKLMGTEPEVNVPGWHFVNRWIQFSDFASWADVVSGFIAAWPENLENADVRSLLESLTTNASSLTERAERALTYLQDEIRYLSVNTEFGGQIPASPAATIKRGFGDCKDKAIAAAHLLRLLGIPARPVLVHTGLRQAIREFLPLPGAFNHAIVEYEIDGRRRWVDVTTSHQGGSALSRPNAPFQVGLPLAAGVVDLEEIKTDESSDRTELQETFRIDTRGQASSLSVLVTVTGREAEKWRRTLAHDGSEAFARTREQFYQHLYPGTQRAGKLEWRDDREGNELVLAETFDLRDIVFPTHDRKSFLFRFPAHAIQSVLGFSDSGKRQHPWELRFPCRLKHTIEIDSSGLPQNLARSAQVAGNAFRFTCHSQQRPGFASITYLLHVLADHVPAAEFEAFKIRVREVWPITALIGQLPPGSIVPRKMRGPDTLLPRSRKPGPVEPRGRNPSQEETPNQKAATAIAPSGPRPPPLPLPLHHGESHGKGTVTPRKERMTVANESDSMRERVSIRRPNPTLPRTEQQVPRTTTRPPRSQRRSRRDRKQTLMWIGTIIGGILLLAMIFFLFHIR